MVEILNSIRMNKLQNKTVFDWAIEISSFLCLIWAFYPLFFYERLDAEILIPTHYNLLGEVDGWGDRSFLWSLPPIAFVVYIILSILQRYPEIYNYPVKVTKENTESLHRLGVQLIRYIKFITILIFAYLNNCSFSSAIEGKNSGLNLYIIGTLTIGLFVVTLFSVIKMVKSK